MRREDQTRLRHLSEAATKAIAYTEGRSRSDLDHDELLRLALTKLVEIVGEAAKQVSPELREAHPDIPWRAAARMRDRLIHHYFDINLDVLWEKVTANLCDPPGRAPRPGRPGLIKPPVGMPRLVPQRYPSSPQPADRDCPTLA